MVQKRPFSLIWKHMIRQGLIKRAVIYVWRRIYSVYGHCGWHQTSWHPKYPALIPQFHHLNQALSLFFDGVSCLVTCDNWQVIMIVDTTSNSFWQNKLRGTVVAKLGQGRDEIICLRHFTAMTIGYFYNFPPFDLCLKYKIQDLRLSPFPPPAFG